MIRKALATDAAASCQVLRRSITELCAADHCNDPAILERWLRNKTPENVAGWIGRADSTLLVAVDDRTVGNPAILAVGSVTDAGEITLNYVSPDARFRGVSKAMLAALEARAAALGNTRITLHSTQTALRFYLSCGYVVTGPADHGFGTAGGWPMTKRLAVP